MKKYLIVILFINSVLAFNQIKDVYLVAEMGKIHMLDDSSLVQMWGYGHVKASLPGPTIYLDLGDSVALHFKNLSAEPHTIHLHGLDVSQYNDGVPATSYWVPFDDSTTYNFVANYAGSYLYHCHVMTTLHLTMGMYGVIVVRNYPDTNLVYSGGPSFHREHVFLATDMDRSINVNPTILGGPIHLMDLDYFMINGLSGIPLSTSSDNQVYAHPGDSVLLRLSNLGYSKTRFIFPAALNAIAYMSDGRTLPSPYACDTLTLHPGERYEVLLIPSSFVDFPIQVEYYDIRNNTLEHINFISVNGDLNVESIKGTLPINIFPNPAADAFTIEVGELNKELVIYNLMGQKIHSQVIYNHSSIIKVSDFQSGIYFVVYNQQVSKLIVS